MIGKTISHCRSIGALFGSFLLLSMLLMAQEWWETSVYLQWSAEEVETILNSSPWVSLAQAGVRTLSLSIDPVSLNPVAEPCGFVRVPILYRVRLITARPVREALLRRLASGKGVEPSISTKDYKTDTEKDRLERFIAARPDDVRVKGDDQYIIVALTLRVLDKDNCDNQLAHYMYWVEEPNADELSRIDTSKLTAETSLATNTNRIALVRYEPPGRDRLGAKYYFPRELSKGVPLIAAADKELRFETRINKSKVRARFELNKMSYHGKLEF